jgi:hypothetical protein
MKLPRITVRWWLLLVAIAGVALGVMLAIERQRAALKENAMQRYREIIAR